jgi:uncharacterized SAM-binding protein YcdF (DUF218 family)
VGFLLRKVLAEVLMPVPLILLVGVVALVLHFRGRPRPARRFAVAAFLLLWAGSCMPLARLAVSHFESAYPAFPGDSVEAVVVLGGGHVSDPSLPVTAVPEAQSLYRITEGVRIARAQPWAEVIFSGYGGTDPRPSAQVGADLAGALGLDPGRIAMAVGPRTTAEEARALAPRLRGKRFALVTSATHMPRAVRLFRAQGLEPVPAPTGHLAKHPPTFDWRDLVPSVGALTLTRQAWYETVAGVWARIGG